jgi:hypothetical protein
LLDQSLKSSQGLDLIGFKPRQRRELRNGGDELVVFWRPLNGVAIVTNSYLL